MSSPLLLLGGLRLVPCGAEPARRTCPRVDHDFSKNSPAHSDSAEAHPDAEVHPTRSRRPAETGCPSTAWRQRTSRPSPHRPSTSSPPCDWEGERPSIMQDADTIYWTFRDPAEGPECGRASPCVPGRVARSGERLVADQHSAPLGGSVWQLVARRRWGQRARGRGGPAGTYDVRSADCEPRALVQRHLGLAPEPRPRGPPTQTR